MVESATRRNVAMPLFRCCALVLLTMGFVALANAQANKPFPTDDEINLLLTQTERAIQQYKPLIDQALPSPAG
jgi:hypothetical protein